MKWNKGFLAMLAKRRFGFVIDEVMTGEHEFEPGVGPIGKHPMEFKATWGAEHITRFANPMSSGFFLADLAGTVTVGGLCERVPCVGKLELKYFSEHSIRYTFDFEVKGESYHFVGEKVNIRLWNLPFSHTTCFGTLIAADTGKLISRSVTYFKMSSAANFISSFRPT